MTDDNIVLPNDWSEVLFCTEKNVYDRLKFRRVHIRNFSLLCFIHPGERAGETFGRIFTTLLNGTREKLESMTMLCYDKRKNRNTVKTGGKF